MLEESNDGGTTWTAVSTMTNALNGVGVLNTRGAIGPSYVPTAAEWASLAYPLTAGANQIHMVANDPHDDVFSIWLRRSVIATIATRSPDVDGSATP